ncbi:MAG: glutamate racemase [Treponema sp.]|jgi:glutamate racemase|nr:glutamate racemase [Treponema sp.]
MDTRTILFLDSGMGGLPYCQYFHRRNPGEPLVYTADRANFPYGPKDKDELAAALVSLIASLREAFRPKLAALVCNTASVSALGVLREAFPGLPFVGTVPAVKPAVMGSVSRRIGVLGTERTMADPCIGELVARYGRDCEVSALAVPELVEWVEYRHAESTAEERLKTVEPYIDYFRKQGVDALVLGCTHFLFLLDEFKLAAGPGIKVYDSMEGVSRRIEAVLDEKVLRVEHEIDATLGGGGAKGLKVPGPQSPPCLQPTASGTPLSGGAAHATPPPGG